MSEQVTGPIDDLILGKVRIAIMTMTSPERLTQSLMASRIKMESVTAMDVANGLSEYLRSVLLPLVE